VIEVVSPATVEHALSMINRIRAEDINEHAKVVSPHTTMEDTLRGSVSISEKSWAGVVDGVVICICGVAPIPQMPGSGAVWLISTYDMELHSTEFLKKSRSILVEMLQVFPHLWNYADVANTRALQWLQWLGFSIHEPIPYGPYGYPFHFFEIRRPDHV